MKREGYAFCLILFVLGVITNACDDNNNEGARADKTLNLTAFIDGLTPEVSSYRFQGGQEVGIYLSTNEFEKLSDANRGKNIRFSQSAGGMVSDPRTLWKNGETLVAYAYSPYDREFSGVPNAYPFEIELRQDEIYAAGKSNYHYDLLWTKQVTEYTGEPVRMNFHHLMNKVLVYVKSNSDTPGALVGSDMYICNTRVKADVNLETGVVTAKQPETDQKVTAGRLARIPTGYEAAYEALLIPQTLAKGTAFLEVHTQGGYSYKWELDEDLNLESGRQITLEAIIDEGECDLVIKEIGEWKDNGEPIYGDAIEDVIMPYDYYDRDGVQGIVVSVDETGKHGWIMSLDEVTGGWLADWASASNDHFNIFWDQPFSIDQNDSESNLEAILAIDPTLEKHPALKWCNDKNQNGVTGWVLPAFNLLDATLKELLKYEVGIKGPDDGHEVGFVNVQKFNKTIRECPIEENFKTEIQMELTEAHKNDQLYYMSSSLRDGYSAPGGNVWCFLWKPGWILYTEDYAGWLTGRDYLSPQRTGIRIRAFHRF